MFWGDSKIDVHALKTSLFLKSSIDFYINYTNKTLLYISWFKHFMKTKLPNLLFDLLKDTQEVLLKIISYFLKLWDAIHNTVVDWNKVSKWSYSLRTRHSYTIRVITADNLSTVTSRYMWTVDRCFHPPAQFYVQFRFSLRKYYIQGEF